MSSIYHTPPVFAVYVVMLVTRWILRDGGGLEAVAARNAHKAELLYAAVDDLRASTCRTRSGALAR